MNITKIFLIIFGALTLAFLAVNLAAAQTGTEPPGRDPVVEGQILEKLASIAPEAVPLFQHATQEMDQGNYQAAKRDYEQVLTLAPGFPDAERRLSYVETSLGNHDAALEHAQKAFDVDPSPFNHLALARALLANGTPASNQSALNHAKIAAEALPQDAEAQFILVLTALTNSEYTLGRQANERALALAPDHPLPHYFAGFLAAEQGQWEKAERELLRSKELGMSAEDVQQALDSGIRSQALLYRSLRRGGYFLAGWLVGLVALFLVGSLLSWITLKAVQQPRKATGEKAGTFERLVRAIYRLVIAISSAYFYISIPVLLLIVIAAAGGIIYLFFAIGKIPLRLVIFVAVAALYTLFIVVRSIFARVKEAEPGRPLSRIDAPALWSLTEEVAAQVGTRPVDAIYITPAPEIAVTERGSLLKKLRGSGQRGLILGLGALPGMEQGQFKAILAHEYGHFSNRDTAGGNFARQVLVAVNTMGFGLAMSGLAKWYNPAWLFVNGFHRIFLRITLGASRLQEILADRYAAITYGMRNFIDGLAHVIRQSVLFNYLVTAEVKDVLQRGGALQNLYTLPPLPSGESQQEAEQKVSATLDKPTGPYDSHPGFRQRVRLIENVGSASVSSGWNDQAPVWDLLPNASALQWEMTALLQRSVDQHRAQNPPGETNS